MTSVAAQVAERVLVDDYALRLGDRVDVALTPYGNAPLIVGRIADATPVVLVLDAVDGSRARVRIPWATIATIVTNTAPQHPAI